MTNIIDQILPEDNSGLPISQWDIDALPEIPRSLPKDYLNNTDGANNIREYLIGLRNHAIKKSETTKKIYQYHAAQFLFWCNELNISIREKVTTTIELRDIAKAYDAVLNKQDFKQNTIALKIMSVRKLFEFINSAELKMDIRAAFNPETITTADKNAFKHQVRINENVYDQIAQYVSENGTINERWIFFFLAFGCRESEICDAKISDIDMLNKKISLFMRKVGDVKQLELPAWFSGKSMFEESQAFIVKYDLQKKYDPTSKSFQKLSPEMQEKVLQNGKRPVLRHHIYNTIQRWKQHTDFSDVKVTPHSFRRYFVNSMYRKGYDILAIASVTGHKSLSTVQKYNYDISVESNPIFKDKAVKYSGEISTNTNGK